jgi:DNA-binding NarL/FixJ family response regulator
MRLSGNILEAQPAAETTPTGESDLPVFSEAAPRNRTALTRRQDYRAAAPAAEISLLVSDSTEIGCELLSSALSSTNCEFQIARTVVSSQDLLDAANASKPEVALVSIGLREGPTAGLEALKELHAQVPATRCILLMDKASQPIMIEALRVGVKGVFLRDSPLQMLCRCIRAVRAGQIWISNADLCHLIEAFSVSVPVTRPAATGPDVLSKREKEIVMLVMQGLSNREVAQQARLSEHTVKNYLRRIFDKLGVSSRAELIVRFLAAHNAGK